MPPLAEDATFVRTVGTGVGTGVPTGVGVGVAACPVVSQASSSVIRLYPARALLTTTLTLVVATAPKLSFVQPFFLLVIEPPVTVAHADPFQYCTSKAVMP